MQSALLTCPYSEKSGIISIAGDRGQYGGCLRTRKQSKEGNSGSPAIRVLTWLSP